MPITGEAPPNNGLEPTRNQRALYIAAARPQRSALDRRSEYLRKESNTISFSRYLAIVLGVLTPIAETVRRWSSWQENPPALFDDYILGAFLLYGAWRVGKDVRSGQRFLAAAWAFMCGMAYSSFFEQLHRLRLGMSDPAPIPSVGVAVIKGAGLSLGIIALLLSLKRLPQSEL